MWSDTLANEIIDIKGKMSGKNITHTGEGGGDPYMESATAFSDTMCVCDSLWPQSIHVVAVSHPHGLSEDLLCKLVQLCPSVLLSNSAGKYSLPQLEVDTA